MNKSINIKKIKTENGYKFRVTILSIKDSNNSVKLQVPHPYGNETKDYDTLENAAIAIKQAGYTYNLPEGEFLSEQEIRKIQTSNTPKNALENLIYDKLASKVNDINSNIVSSAIKGLALLNNENAIEIFLNKLGDDNDIIRNAAIDALVCYENDVVDLLLDALSDSNWVKRNSAITCLVKISEIVSVNIEKIMVPLINRLDDVNPIVQANALISTAKIYTNSQKFVNE